MDRDPFDLVGATLDGRFRVVALAGRGDLSVVYKGHHMPIDAPVAIKCLDLPPTLDGALVRPLVESFREGSRIHTRLARGHRSIAQSFASGSTLAPATGMIVPYLVREWFEGESLASDLARRRTEGRKGRSFEEVVALLQSAVEAVSYAHSQGSPHLSLNPSNLFLAERSGKRILRVLDFGIARAMNDLACAIPAGSRPAGLRALFAAYAAPEQLDAAAGPPGAWTDVYALAVLVLELLSDRVMATDPPIWARGDPALAEASREPLMHGLDLPGNFDRVLRRATAREPGQRQKDATELWNDVTTSLRASTARASRSTQPPSVAGAVPSRRLMVPVGPSTATLPMGFGTELSGRTQVHASVAANAQEPDRSVVHVVSTPPPPRAATPVLPPVIVADDSPPAPAAEPTPSVPLPRLPRLHAPTFPTLDRPLFGRRWGPAVASVVAAVIGASLGTGLVVSFSRHRPAHVSVPPSLVTGSSVSPSVPVLPPGSALPPIPPSTPESDTAGVPSVSPPLLHFPVAAARQALDAASRGMARCKLGKRWGTATASVTFGNDGSVSQVSVGVPFTGTASGRCVADTLKKATLAPFAGKPGLVAYRFFVPPK